MVGILHEESKPAINIKHCHPTQKSSLMCKFSADNLSVKASTGNVTDHYQRLATVGVDQFTVIWITEKYLLIIFH